jgi:hypothetical protein
MQTWPAWFPNCSLDVSTKVASAVSRTQMEDGFVKQASREVANQRTISVQWEFDKDQFAEFQSFFKHSLSNGADWFEATVPVSGAMETKVVRFVGGEFSHSHFAILSARVSATLEARD